jgi:hypothetical protein
MRNGRNRSGSARIEILVATGLGLYVVGTLGYLVFGATFFVVLAFIVACVFAWARAASVSHKRRMARERRRRRSQRIAAHDAFWLEDRAA